MTYTIRVASGLWVITALVGFLLSLIIAWHVLSPLNFFYSQWYSVIGIDENIAEYGPLNRNRKDFATTGRVEHERLMAELVAAINNGGKGLTTIEYKDNKGSAIDTLLTDAEITHMRDVAQLIHWMNICGAALAIILLVLLVWMRRAAIKMSGLSGLFIKMAVLLVVLAVLVLIIGPVKLFYQLHVWLFPDKHQWFFYYEDSLMTTMLKAPVIFGPIAIAWLLIALLIWWLIFSVVLRFMRPMSDDQRGYR
ncbi:MAG: DUF1461 domain-containing protein [Gammaproteobacteria bacterium]|nr:DUF1461 domain-containing protein [Gammaproteobacteria bacterium]